MKPQNNRELDTSNPVIRAILNRNTEPNPAYNPKTKVGRMQPMTITTPAPTDFRGGEGYEFQESTKDMRYDNLELGLTPKEIDKYAEYGVAVNPYTYREDWDRIRAENQSAGEKFRNFIVQSIGNEVVLGTFKGISDMIDAGISAFTGDNDFTNPISKFFEDIQENIRDEFGIYQKKPGESWALGDFGWWMNNAVSVLSTASIFLPVAGASRILSLLGKATKLNKLGRGLSYGIGKLAKGAHLTKSPGRLALTMNRGTKITRDAFLSRTVENYQEARGVYKEVYDDALDRLNNMSDEDRKQFYKINTDLIGLSNEEVAKQIAGLSANETFQNDYAMLAMDIMQYKALAGMWKGTTKTNVSAGIRGFNKRMAETISVNGDKVDKALQRVTLRDRWNGFKDSPFKTATQSIIGVEWSEGIEEGYQNIQTEKGKEVAEKIFNPKYNTKTIGDYLNDPATWEAAFWGVLGGVGFKKIGDGVNRLGEAIENKWNKHKPFDKELHLTGMSVEKAQAAEIAGRQAEFIKLKSDIETINNGFHPDKIKTDEKDEAIRDSEGNVQQLELTPEEQAVAKQEVLDKFITNLSINAAENGTYDLLKEFIKDPNVKKYLKDQGLDSAIEDPSFSEYAVRKMDQVYDTYANAVYDVFNSVDVGDEYLGKMTARSIARNKLTIDNLTDKRNEVLAAINKNNTENADYNEYYEQQLIKEIDSRIEKIRQDKNTIERFYNEEVISRQARDLYIEEKDAELKRLEKLLEDKSNSYSSILENATEEEKKSMGKDFLTKYNHFKSKYTQSQKSQPKKSLQQLVDTLVTIDNKLSEHEDATPKNQKEINDLYNRQNRYMDIYIKEKYKDAVDKVRKWISDQENLEDASSALAKGEIKEIQEELDMLKMGYDTKNSFIGSIEEEIGAEMEKRDKKAKDAKKVEVDGKRVSNKEGERINEHIENALNEENEAKTNIRKATQSDSIEVGDIVTSNNYGANGNIISAYTQVVARTYNNGGFTDTTGVDVSPSRLKAFFDKASYKYNGAHTEIVKIEKKDGTILTHFTGEETQIESAKSAKSAESTKPTESNNVQQSTTSTKSEQLSKQQLEEATEDLNEARKEIAELTLSNDDLALSYAWEAITNIIKEDKDKILSLDANDYNTNKYHDLVNEIAEQLITKGVTPNLAHSFAEKQLQIILKQLSIATKNNKYKDLAYQIALGAKVKRDEHGMASSVEFMGAEEMNPIIEQFIDEYTKLRGIKLSKTGKTIIDVEDLIHYIVTKSDLSVEEAKFIIRNIRGFINANQSKKYKFDKRSVAYGLQNDISALIEDIINRRSTTIPMGNRIHISQLTNATKRNEAKEVLSNRKKDSKITAVKKNNTVEILLDGKPIGYLTEVTNDKNGLGLKLNVSDKSKEDRAKTLDTATIYYTVSNGENGRVVSNMDELFEGIIEANESNKLDEIFELLEKFKDIEISGDKNGHLFFTDKEAKTILNNPVIKKLIKEKDIVLPEVSYVGGIATVPSETFKAYQLLSAINKIINYDNKAKSVYDKLYSFGQWKKSIKQNYEETKKIQDAVNTGKPIKINIDQIDEGRLNYGNEHTTKNNLDDVFPVNKNENGDLEHPLIYCKSDRLLVDDNGVKYEMTLPFMRPGDMGVLVDVKNGKPMIARVTDTASIYGRGMGTLVEKEIIRLLTSFVRGNANGVTNNMSFDDLYRHLSDLMGGRDGNRGKGGDHLFYGYEVIKTDKYIGISRPGRENQENGGFIAMIHKFKPDGKTLGTGITIFNPNYPKGRKSFYNEDIAGIREIANTIVKGLKYNRMFFMANNQANPSTPIVNRYFRKTNGKFVITGLTPTPREYNSYTEFVFGAKAFYTNQKQSENGSYYVPTENSGSVYISTSEIVRPQTPVEGQTTTKTITQLITESTEEIPAKSSDILDSMGVSNEAKRLLIGEVEGIPSLVPDSVIFDPDLKDENAYTYNGKVYIGKVGLRSMKKGLNHTMSILIHERLHNLINETNPFRRANLVKDLLNTYSEAVRAAKSIKKREPYYKEAQAFLKAVNKNFSIENYANGLSEQGKKAWNSFTDEQKERRFAEEWLVESLTQPELMKFLNNIKYGDAVIDDNKPKTLWQKILQALFKLFNGNREKIKDFSILAEHFNLLGEEINNNRKNKSNVIAETKNEEITEKEENVNNTEEDIFGTEIEEEESEDTKISETNDNIFIDDNTDIDDDLMSSIISDDYIYSSVEFMSTEEVDFAEEVRNNPNVDPIGVELANDIVEYLETYPPESRDRIKKLIDDGYIEFVCKR